MGAGKGMKAHKLRLPSQAYLGMGDVVLEMLETKAEVDPVLAVAASLLVTLPGGPRAQYLHRRS